MNIFRLGRGELFGIIIPGAFLLLNILAFIPLLKFGIDISKPIIGKTNAVNITIFLVLSYVIGFSLRLINPDLIERLTFYLRVPWLYCYSLFYARKKSKDFSSYYSKQLKIYRESFPYIDWFYDYYLKKSPYSIALFFENVCNQEFLKNKDLMAGRIFINQCKLYVRLKSVELNEELMFREGLVRFLSGMSCAFFFCAFIVLFNNPLKLQIFYLYIILFFIFARKLRYIRFKEVGLIFTSFAFCVMASDNAK
jgi:hypothetical protein